MSSVFIVLSFVVFSSAWGEPRLQRLDPHGAKDFKFQAVTDLGENKACGVCHNQAGDKLGLKPEVSQSCMNCHNSAPHAGVLEHTKANVTCLNCHVPHRSEAKAGMAHGSFISQVLWQKPGSTERTNPNAMIRKTCVECHQASIKAESSHKKKSPGFVHNQHLEAFHKINVRCTDCHSMDIKTTTSDPLAKPVGRGGLKVASAVCKECHGFSAQANFAKSCQLCHDKQASIKLDHPIAQKVQCLSCHQPKSQTHRSLSYQGASSTCLSCHLDKKIRHRALSLLQNTAKFQRLNLENKKLSCFTCHSVHQAGASKPLLAHPEESEKFCASCHGAKAKKLFEGFHKEK